MLKLLLLVLALVLSLLPVKLAAMIVGAKRTGLAWCFLATVVAGVLHTVGLSFPGPGYLFSVLLAGVGYSAILKTSYAGGLVITVLQFLIVFGMIVAFGAVFGVMNILPALGPVVV